MQYLILCYVPRSGSTLLARLIAEYEPNIAVLPEFRTPELLFSAGEVHVKNMKSDELLQLFISDHQIENLKLSDDILNKIALGCRGKGILNVLTSIIEEYLRSTGQSALNTVLIKLGSLMHLANDIRKVIPKVSFIHIVRDPRGVINSQIHTERPHFPGEMMGRGDPYYSAVHWRSYIKKVDRLAKLGYSIYELQYENLIADYRSEMECLSLYLKQPRYNERSVTPAYKVTGREAKIHVLANQNPISKRTVAWQHELQPTAGYVVERLTRSTMLQRGYRPYFTDELSKSQRIKALVTTWSTHVLYTLLYYGRRIIYYITNGYAARHRTRLMIKHIKSRVRLKVRI